MSRRLLLPLAVLLALLSSTGCVGSEPRLSHQEYEVEMQAVARDMNAKAAGMEVLARAPSEATFAELLQEMGGVMRAAAERVGELNPPEEIDRPHEALADALDEIADIIGRAADSAENGDFLGAMSALEDAPDELARDVEQAIAEIRTAGFYIGDSDDWG
jgi:DNA helicase HerA-like ATPase